MLGTHWHDSCVEVAWLLPLVVERRRVEVFEGDHLAEAKDGED